MLTYYAIANCAAWTLRRAAIPVVGLLGCVTLAATLPARSVLAGGAVLGAGVAVYAGHAVARRWG